MRFVTFTDDGGHGALTLELVAGPEPVPIGPVEP